MYYIWCSFFTSYGRIKKKKIENNLSRQHHIKKKKEYFYLEQTMRGYNTRPPLSLHTIKTIQYWILINEPLKRVESKISLSCLCVPLTYRTTHCSHRRQYIFSRKCHIEIRYIKLCLCKSQPSLRNRPETKNLSNPN